MPVVWILIAIHVVAAIVFLHATGALGPGGH
jgi:hypothetical protein